MKFCQYILSLIFFPAFLWGQAVPEACSGFQWPLAGQYFGTGSCGCGGFCNNGGLTYIQTYQYSCGNVYHPGEDLNVPCFGSCNGDMGQPVYAVADGIVRAVSNGWGALVIEHNYQGQSWYSQYGHSRNVLVNVGTFVNKGQQVCEVGNIGTGCAHLHFEIRKNSHPSPTNAGFFCGNGGNGGLFNLNNVLDWYEDPKVFIPNKTPYNCGNSCQPVHNVNTTFNSGNHVFEASDHINSAAKVENGANVELRGTQYVRLQNGFHAKPGSQFKANLDGCN